MASIRELKCELDEKDNRKVTFHTKYISCIQLISPAGEILESDCSEMVAAKKRKSPAARIGSAVRENLPKFHALYSVVAGKVASKLGKKDAVYIRALELCQTAGPNDQPCEFLIESGGEPGCSFCGCPHSAVRTAGLLTECMDSEDRKWVIPKKERDKLWQQESK